MNTGTKVAFITDKTKDSTTGIHAYAEQLAREVQKTVNLSYTYPAPLINTHSTTINQIISCINSKADVYHYTAPELATHDLRRKNSVVTFHDLAPLVTNLTVGNPAVRIGFLARKMQLLKYKWSAQAKHIIAVSHHTKQEVMSLLKVPEDRITVIHEGVDHNLFKPRKIERAEYTILYVGSETPRKNLNTIIDALALVNKELPDVKLIKIGRPQWQGAREQLIERINKLGLQHQVIFKDYVSDAQKSIEYCSATAFIIPSVYEGFGLPLLEAMACGTPCLASNATSLPEIGGDTVEYFNPYDSKDMARHIINVLADKNLQAKLSRKAHQRSLQFTWEKTARETIKVYKMVNTHA